MDQKAYLENLRRVLAPFATQYLFRTQNDMEILTMLIPISDGVWQIRLEVCTTEVTPDTGVVEFYSTLQENLSSEEAYAQAAADWNRDSFGTYGIFRREDTVALFHRHMNVMDGKQAMQGLVDISKRTVLVLLHELERHVPALQQLAAPAG